MMQWLLLLYLVPSIWGIALHQLEGVIILFISDSAELSVLNKLRDDYREFIVALGGEIKYEYDTIFTGLAVTFNNYTEIIDNLESYCSNQGLDDYEKFVAIMRQYRQQQLTQWNVTLDISPDIKVETYYTGIADDVGTIM